MASVLYVGPDVHKDSIVIALAREGREAVEAIRDLERARDDAKSAERVARHQLSKFLLRHDRHWGATTWTLKRRDWIRTQESSYPAKQRVLEDYLKTGWTERGESHHFGVRR